MENINLDLFNPKKAELIEAANKYKNLEIKGLDDKEGYELVHKAEMELKKYRTTIDKTRKDYTRQFDEAKKQAIGLANELIGIVSEVEKELKEKKQKIDEEKAKIKEEQERKKTEELNKKIQQLSDVGYHIDVFNLQLMDEETFNETLEKAKIDFEEKEKERKYNLHLLQINSCETLEELDSLGINEEIFENIIKQKRELLEFQRDKQLREEKLKKENIILETKNNIISCNDLLKLQEIKDDFCLFNGGNYEDIKKEYESRLELLELKEKTRKEEEQKTRQIELEKAKKEAAEIARKQEQDRIILEEQNRIKKEQEEQEKINKQKKYKDFLVKCGITEENKNDFKIIKDEDNKKMLVYKIIDSFDY